MSANDTPSRAEGEGRMDRVDRDALWDLIPAFAWPTLIAVLVLAVPVLTALSMGWRP
jgi:hypothetical protein